MKPFKPHVEYDEEIWVIRTWVDPTENDWIIELPLVYYPSKKACLEAIQEQFGGSQRFDGIATQLIIKPEETESVDYWNGRAEALEKMLTAMLQQPKSYPDEFTIGKIYC